MRTIALLFVITFAFIRCNKADNSPANSRDFTGKWKIISQSGGIAGHTIQIPADSIFILTLNRDKSYRYMRNSRLVANGQYALTTMNNGYLIMFDGRSLSQDISTRNDSLYVHDRFPDGYGTLYIKVKR